MIDNIKKNAFWNTLGITFNSFNSLFFLIIVSRINGINDAGVFGFSFALASLWFIIGLYAGRTFQVSDIYNETSDSEYLVHKVWTASLMVLVAIVYVYAKGYHLEKSIVILALTIYKALEAFSDTLYGYLQKKQLLYIAGISLFWKSFVAVFLFLLVDLLTKNLVLACLSIIFVNLIFIFSYDFPNVNKIMTFEKIEVKNTLALFKKGFSIFIFSFLSIYIVNVSKYVIDEQLANQFQAVFNIIVMPATIISLCGQYIVQPLLNQLIEYFYNHKYKELKKTTTKISLALLMIDIIAILGAFLLGIPVLNLLYGVDVSAYRFDLLIVIAGALFYSCASVYSTVLITMRKTTPQIFLFATSSLVGLFLAKHLVTAYHIHGAIYAYFMIMLLHFSLIYGYFYYEYRQLIKDEHAKSNGLLSLK